MKISPYPFCNAIGNMTAESLLEKVASKVAHATHRTPLIIDDHQRREQKELLLACIASTITEPSKSECRLRFDRRTKDHAVFIITTEIEFGEHVKLSRAVHQLMARHVGITMDSVSHWALCVVDRGLGECFCYDLMSDQLALNALGKNYFRAYVVTVESVRNWNSCFYVGETRKSHEEIQEIGASYMSMNPRYNLLTNNCQNLVEKMVKDLCDGKVITQWKLTEELARVAPKIGLYVMVARLAANVLDKKKSTDSKTVIRDIKFINGLRDLDKEKKQSKAKVSDK